MRCRLIAVAVLATWTARWWTFATCDVNKPRLNAFNGKMETPSVQYAVACFDKNEEKMSRRFDDQAAAEEFFKECDDQSSAAFSPNAVRCDERTIEKISE